MKKILIENFIKNLFSVYRQKNGNKNPTVRSFRENLKFNCLITHLVKSSKIANCEKDHNDHLLTVEVNCESLIAIEKSTSTTKNLPVTIKKIYTNNDCTHSTTLSKRFIFYKNYVTAEYICRLLGQKNHFLNRCRAAKIYLSNTSNSILPFCLVRHRLSQRVPEKPPVSLFLTF